MYCAYIYVTLTRRVDFTGDSGISERICRKSILIIGQKNRNEKKLVFIATVEPEYSVKCAGCCASKNHISKLSLAF